MKKNLTKLSVFAILILLIASCKKNNINYDSLNPATVVELPLAAYAGPAAYDSGGFIYNISDSVSSVPQPFPITVYINGKSPLSTATTVTLTINKDALLKINAEHRAAYAVDSIAAAKDTTITKPDPTFPKYLIYQLLPTTAYTMQGLTVTVPAGQLRAADTVNVTTSKLTYGQAYMLPITITDAGGQKIGYYNTVYFAVGLQNPYVGDYTANGSISFPDPTSNRTWSARDKQLTVVTPYTVETEAADLSSAGYYIDLTINPDNTVVVRPDASSVNQTITNNGPCTYDPATKTFTLNYRYVGGTGDRIITETITKN